MLRGIDPILPPDLLYILRAMGHGDAIVVADGNFPGERNAQNLVRLDGVEATHALKAILELMPLDTFAEDPAVTMQMVDDPEGTPPIVESFQQIIDQVADNSAPIKAIERFDFYERSREAFAIVQTGERRLYGNIILKKGVIPVPGAD